MSDEKVVRMTLEQIKNNFKDGKFKKPENRTDINSEELPKGFWDNAKLVSPGNPSR